MSTLLLAVDGGNAKTDLALVAADGSVLALVRGPGSSPHEHGVEGCARPHRGAADRGRRATAPSPTRSCCSRASTSRPRSRPLQRRARERGWAERVEVANDTFAVLRAGTERGWGVAVVCGAGSTASGSRPTGGRCASRRSARSPATGAAARTSGCAAVSAAARSEDGRGPRTTLERLVPAHFGLATPLRLAEAVHTRRDLATPLRRARADRARGPPSTRSPPDRRAARGRGRRRSCGSRSNGSARSTSRPTSCSAAG